MTLLSMGVLFGNCFEESQNTVSGDNDPRVQKLFLHTRTREIRKRSKNIVIAEKYRLRAAFSPMVLSQKRSFRTALLATRKPRNEVLHFMSSHALPSVSMNRRWPGDSLNNARRGETSRSAPWSALGINQWCFFGSGRPEAKWRNRPGQRLT